MIRGVGRQDVDFDGAESEAVYFYAQLGGEVVEGCVCRVNVAIFVVMLVILLLEGAGLSGQ